jgi:hypothetical protein
MVGNETGITAGIFETVCRFHLVGSMPRRRLRKPLELTPLKELDHALP